MAVDAPNPISSMAAAVNGALRKAAQKTGANFDYLLATAKVESNLNTNLAMRSSSATGLFQFIEQTWLATLKQAGQAVGYGQYASAITQTPSGHYVVQDPSLRHDIMALRKDPTANAVMAGVFTQHNAAVVGNRIGRPPSEGELYIAHFFGPAAASKLINAARVNPQANGAAMFPHAARANHTIFYDKQGNARGVAGVYGELIHRYQVARSGAPTGAVASASAPAGTTPSASTSAPARTTPPSLSAYAPAGIAPTASAFAPVAPVNDTAGMTQVLAAANEAPQPARPAPSFNSLFSNDDRRSAISPAVAQLWTTPSSASPEESASPAPASEPEPLDLFRDLPANGRALFGGKG